MAIQVNKNLTFLLGEEVHGIPVLKVKAIIGMMAITPVPRMPKFVKVVMLLNVNQVLDDQEKSDLPA